MTFRSEARMWLRLAYETAREELHRWRNPPPAGEPAPAVAPMVDRPVVQSPAPEKAPATPSKWTSTAFHMEALKSTICPDCTEPKAVGSYRCKPCHEKAVSNAT